MSVPIVIYSIFASLFGLAVGSFLNVVIHRVPDGASVVAPASRCPHCGRGVRPLDNIPLLSFVLLGGRCRDCKARISFVYPAVELLTALVFVLLVVKHGPGWETGLRIVFACAIIALIFIDLRHQLLPNVITYPLFPFAIVAAMLLAAWARTTGPVYEFSILLTPEAPGFSPHRAAIIGGTLLLLAAIGFRIFDWLDGILFGKYFEGEEFDEESDDPEIRAILEREQALHRNSNRVIAASMAAGLLLTAAWVVLALSGSATSVEPAYDGLLRASWGALVGGGTIWGLRTVYFFLRGMEGMGLGDVKLMCGIGAFLGGPGAFGVLLIGSIFGAVAGSVLAYRGQDGLKTALPFGVCLGLAALIVLLMR